MRLWQEHQLAPFAVSALPHEQGPWLVLAPHADDESIGMGGTIAKAVQRGIDVHLLVLTDGAQGGTQSDLVQRRQQEVREVVACLGIRSVRFLDQPDRDLQAGSALAWQVAALVAQWKAAAVFFPGVQELHPDHRAAALLAWQSLQCLGAAAPAAIAYEITGQSPINCLVDISSEMPLKERAIGVYASQLSAKPYIELVRALNKLRTLTLPATVQWAEGFYCFDRAALAQPLPEWAAQRMRNMLTAS